MDRRTEKNLFKIKHNLKETLREIRKGKTMPQEDIYSKISEILDVFMAESKENPSSLDTKAKEEAPDPGILVDQTVTIDRLRARVSELKGALQPFIEAALDCGIEEEKASDSTHMWESAIAMALTLGDFRRAIATRKED